MTVDSSLVKFTPARPGQPVPEIRTISGDRPVFRAELPDGRIVWLVSGYENVRQMLVDQRFSRALAVAPGRAQQGFEMFAAGSINGMDPPEHTRLRKLVASAFTARRVEALRPRVADIVNQLIDAMGRPAPASGPGGRLLTAAAGPGDLRDARRARRGHRAVPCLVRHHHGRLAARFR
jgi:cytochrome P450